MAALATGRASPRWQLDGALTFHRFDARYRSQRGHVLPLDLPGNDTGLAHLLIDVETHTCCCPHHVIEALGVDGQHDPNGFDSVSESEAAFSVSPRSSDASSSCGMAPP